MYKEVVHLDPDGLLLLKKVYIMDTYLKKALLQK
jgi:hypothetical protein